MIYNRKSHFSYSIKSEFIYVLANASDKPITYYSTINAAIGLGVILEGSSEIKIGDQWKKVPRFSIFGMANKPVAFRMSPNYKEVSIGFSACNFSAYVEPELVNFSRGKISNAASHFNLNCLEQLFKGLKNSPSLCESQICFDHFFNQRPSINKPQYFAQSAIDLIYNKQIYKVEDLAYNLGTSSTTLRNQFKACIGLTPKEMIRIYRINSLFSKSEQHHSSLTEMSYSLGYFDQAHFTKDFKLVMGISPKLYFKNKRLAFDFYNFGRWQTSSFAQNNQKKRPKSSNVNS